MFSASVLDCYIMTPEVQVAIDGKPVAVDAFATPRIFAKMYVWSFWRQAVCGMWFHQRRQGR